MPRKSTRQPHAEGSYWEHRLGSTAFKHALTETLTHELHALAKSRVADVLDRELVRRAIREWDTRLIDRTRLADLIIETQRRGTTRLGRQQGSLLDMLDKVLVADVEALLTGLTESSAGTKEFVGGIMRQEFVRRLFTDIIFTSIVSFNRKVNPLFGGLTMRVLEDQIKGFIRMFMPMLVEQATAFAVSHDNQRIALDFARQIIRQLLDRPLRSFAVTAAPAQQKKVEAVIRKAVTNANLEAVIRKAALAAWDDIYSAVRQQRIGDLLRLDEHAGWLVERLLEAMLPVLVRPHVVRLIADEAALAATSPSPARRK